MNNTSVKKEIYDTIEIIPEEMLGELLNYADYLATKSYGKELPDRIVIKDTDDLKENLKRRIDKIKTGKANFYSVEEAREKLMWKIIWFFILQMKAIF